jgi:transcriptional regulator with XRE-family HTH domain
VVSGARNPHAEGVNSNDNLGDYDAAALGRVVRRARVGVGLTQEGLAEACDMHPTYVSLIERGRTKPTLEKLWAIAHQVGLRPSALVALVEDEAAHPG